MGIGQNKVPIVKPGEHPACACERNAVESLNRERQQRFYEGQEFRSPMPVVPAKEPAMPLGDY